MLRYTVKRILLAVPTFLGITVVTFAVVHLAPGEPMTEQFDDASSRSPSKASHEQLRHHFGLDQPLHVQYASWLSRVVRLDFGNSFSDHRPVWDRIRERLPWTLSISVLSIVLGLLIAVPIGVLSAAKPNGWFDRIAGTMLYALYSIPGYVMGMLLIVLVVTWPIDWLPIRGAVSDDFDHWTWGRKLVDIATHMILITACFTYPSLAFQSRFVRGNLLEALRQDYVRAARAKGLGPWSVIMRHGMRNTLIPLLTHLGLLFPSVVAGSAILEVMFGWPGIGRLMYDGILQRDYPTVMALSVITAILVQLGTLAADLSYAWADPRIRYDRRDDRAL